MTSDNDDGVGGRFGIDGLRRSVMFDRVGTDGADEDDDDDDDDREWIVDGTVGIEGGANDGGHVRVEINGLVDVGGRVGVVGAGLRFNEGEMSEAGTGGGGGCNAFGNGLNERDKISRAELSLSVISQWCIFCCSSCNHLCLSKSSLNIV